MDNSKAPHFFLLILHWPKLPPTPEMYRWDLQFPLQLLLGTPFHPLHFYSSKGDFSGLSCLLLCSNEFTTMITYLFKYLLWLEIQRNFKQSNQDPVPVDLLSPTSNNRIPPLEIQLFLLPSPFFHQNMFCSFPRGKFKEILSVIHAEDINSKGCLPKVTSPFPHIIQSWCIFWRQLKFFE